MARNARCGFAAAGEAALAVTHERLAAAELSGLVDEAAFLGQPIRSRCLGGDGSHCAGNGNDQDNTQSRHSDDSRSLTKREI